MKNAVSLTNDEIGKISGGVECKCGNFTMDVCSANACEIICCNGSSQFYSVDGVYYPCEFYQIMGPTRTRVY